MGVVFPIGLLSVKLLVKSSEEVTVEQSSEGSDWEPSEYLGTGDFRNSKGEECYSIGQ